MADKHEKDAGHHDDGHHINYFKIYVFLLILFAISVAGPEIAAVTGWAWITLVAAFGVAVWKASLVVQNFMHLKWEKRVMKWMLSSSLILMCLMVAGVSVDVLNHEGNNWENVAAREATARGLDGGEEEAEEVPEEVASGEFNPQGTFNIVCASCHGAAGDGSGPAGAALDPHPANFTDPEFWAERDRDRIVQVITNGAASVGGSPLMVAWGASFTDEQIQQLADYVMTFRPNG